MSSEAQMDLCRLLVEHWDPLGVRNVDLGPEPRYEQEAETLLRLLRGDADHAMVFGYLLEHEALLGRVERDRSSCTASIIIDWWRGSGAVHART